MKKRGVILVLGIFVISSLIVVFNSYNVSNPIISENPSENEKSFDQNTLPKTSAIDPFEPNNDSGSAFFFMSEGYHTNLNLSSNTDEDWFYIWVDFDKTLVINLYFSHSNGDINLELYNSSINFLTGSYSITDDESINFLINNPDFYYFRIFNETNSNYDLEVIIDDRYEPNNFYNNAVYMGLGLYPSLKCRDDDWFKFWIVIGQQFTVDLYFTHSISDNIELALWDNFSTFLKDSYSTDDNESITWTAGYSGYYFIHIFNAVNTSYDLDIYISGFVEDSYEENDFFGTAIEILPGLYSPLACKDDDWFKFQINSGEQFSVDIYFSHGISDIDLELKNFTDGFLAGSYSVDNDEHITWIASYPGYYYIHIYNLGSDNAYALDIKIGTFGEDPFEENDIIDDAWDLPPHYHPNLYCQDDDWFKFWVSPGDQITISIHFNNGSGNLDLELYNNTGGFLFGSYSMNDDEYIVWSAGYSDFYKIRIFNTGQANFYDLDIKFVHDPYEPNNDFFSAVELYRGSHYNLWCKDDDWYKLPVSSGEQIIVQIYFEHTSGNLDMEIYNNFTIMLWGLYSWDDDESITFTATYSGDYYIRVYNQSASDENWYVMVLGGQPDIIFQEDFEGPISTKWSGFGGSNYWHVTSWDYSPSSPSHSLWCGDEGSKTYDKGFGVPYTDAIVITDLDLRDYCFAGLYFDFKYTTGTNKDDEIGVSVKVLGEQFYLNPKYTDNDFNLLNRYDNTTGWENMSYDLSFFCGYEHVDIIFYFKANDFDNNYEGVMIDNIRIDGMVDDIHVGNSLGIEVEDEYYYYISYIDNNAWSNEIFGRGIFWGDAYIKIEIFAIYDMGSYWDVVARFWEPWDDFDDLANTEEVHYKIYKNPLNMKDGADLFIPYNNLWTYLDKADNYDRFDWFGGYDIHHWYDNYRNEHNIEFSYDDFRVHLIYSSNGILVGMRIHKSSADYKLIFEMWRSDYSDKADEEPEEERDAIPGYDIPIFITLISIMSIISAIRIKKLTKK
jgi:hypothetical protein